MREIPLTQGKVALVDDVDYDWLNRFKWCAHQNKNGLWYAHREMRIGVGRKNRLTVSMHCEILGLKFGDKRQGDHQNHNGLDNRRANIRICTQGQNNCNARKSKLKTSCFRGVSWDTISKKWRSRISVNNKTIFLGRFLSEELAALAHDFAAVRFHREFAIFNF